MKAAEEIAAEMAPGVACTPRIVVGDEWIALDSWDAADEARVLLAKAIEAIRAEAYAAGKADGMEEERERAIRIAEELGRQATPLCDARDIADSIACRIKRDEAAERAKELRSKIAALSVTASGDGSDANRAIRATIDAHQRELVELGRPAEKGER